MTAPAPVDPHRTAFLVERYLPTPEAGALADSVTRVARLCADLDGAGAAVQYLHSAYLPTEDTCFCLFRAVSANDVSAVNSAAAFSFDRITEAVLLFSVEPHN
jgi:Protein of unknown function (DUF4242)